MLTSILVISGLAAAFGLLLGYASIRFHVEGNPVADKLDTLLPQSQCGQCGFPGCRPFAEAVASGEAPINACPPGGEDTMLALAETLGVDPMPMGEEDAGEAVVGVAVIDEQECIGCTICIKACPVDAILGTTRQMHTVIASECTGCQLCIEPCPVDCITLESIEKTTETWSWALPGSPEEIAFTAKVVENHA
ncbi:MAG: electron transport complex subunit RsxB [Candidatus Polarisedimenticolaceae bacterium]|nr:electron transport complex subunit RsxB [Candidatus Polarisedimenticolaceae bacterium]